MINRNYKKSSKQRIYNILYTISLEDDKESIIEFLKSKPKIPSENINILYETEIWDGPLEGLASWNSDHYYFFNIRHLEGFRARSYFLIKLTDDQLRNEEELHGFFLKYVESYPQVKERNVIYRKDAEWDKYHDACEKYPDQIIEADQIVGWFGIKD